MRKLIAAMFVALLMAGCGGSHEEQTTAKIRLAKENGATVLELHGKQISDLTPLAELVDLKKLGLGHNQITDLKPLANLIQLNTLWLPDNQINDLTPLTKLTKLKMLYLNGNPIPDDQQRMLIKALPNCRIQF
ncbi:MAG: hypothetical protein CMI31_09575 [Opitutae bacterium]|nr:hypothetical protein [Opitutae bacterium]|tara:strand:+ start:726 stop:1124 length:399 start_codon:yes stop_codon:yes gene_type:complete